MIDIPDEERNNYFADISKVANAMYKLFPPDKIYYGVYSDSGSHLHFHVIPKYEGEFE